MGVRKSKQRRMRNDFVKKQNRMPAPLIFAALFITMICISYVLKINGLFMDIANSGGSPKIITVLMAELDLIFLTTTVIAALGISSHKSEAWRKIVRSCFTFTLATVMSATLIESTSYSHKFDFNPYATAIILIILLLIMVFNRDIKSYYTPPMTAVPKTSKWIAYAFWGRLFNTDYRIVFRNVSDSGRQPDAGNGPDETCQTVYMSDGQSDQ